MPKASAQPEVPAAIQINLTAIFVSLELSRSTWIVTSLSPGAGEKMSKHSVAADDISALLLRFDELKRKAKVRTKKSFPIIAIQEAGLDGFWLHRLLEAEGVESHVVDPASITTSRRRGKSLRGYIGTAARLFPWSWGGKAGKRAAESRNDGRGPRARGYR